MKYLYHGTAFSKLPGIAEAGLFPRTGPSVWKDHPSIEGQCGE